MVVCLSGPIPSTRNDFWRMIWEQKVTMVIMSTGLVERGRVSGSHDLVDFNPGVYHCCLFMARWSAVVTGQIPHKRKRLVRSCQSWWLWNTDLLCSDDIWQLHCWCLGWNTWSSLLNHNIDCKRPYTSNVAEMLCKLLKLSIKFNWPILAVFAVPSMRNRMRMRMGANQRFELWSTTGSLAGLILVWDVFLIVLAGVCISSLDRYTTKHRSCSGLPHLDSERCDPPVWSSACTLQVNNHNHSQLSFLEW